MDAEWVRYLGLIAGAVIGFFARQWFSSMQQRQEEKNKAIWKELNRLSKNYHNLAEYLRKIGVKINLPELQQEDEEDGSEKVKPPLITK